MADKPQVLIVGAGPTGLSAALFLADLDIPVRIVEQHSGLSEHSKAFGVNPRTLSLLESTGVTERLLRQGHKMRGMNLWRHGRVIFAGDLTKVDHKYPFMLVHSQADSERALADAVIERGIPVEFNTHFESLKIEGDGSITCSLTLPNGESESYQANALLGADGPRSTVREQLGFEYLGDHFAEPWMVIDLELETDLATDHAHLEWHDEGAVFMLCMADNLWRVAGNVLPVTDYLPGNTTPGTIRWQSEFHLRHCVTSQFAEGPVALAGDAAHLHSPLGGRGMNLGIEDAYVFAHLVAAGRLGDYHRLRSPVVHSVVRRVEQMTQVARGRTKLSHLARQFAPLASAAMNVGEGNFRKWVLGLDHPVNLE
ncbi:FAD-dependent monooxygenase [Aeoliella sp. ICT_H6.2]|uniref:FAD-dependent monooxygenase n=1 Tax=Aeoliella straminimaris TaxID=2954799 RepID=A0A9X2FFF6_9BACT|nr:FAD-dependent monooxygenase [Aeoliella straminimaris]MCO6048125.1 FAD-dependent monooxygenase [Aeoliella straminimaris]